jgi:Fe-S cluster assembly protein SufD
MDFTEANIRATSSRNQEPQWLINKRLAAFRKFSELQWPTQKEEEWRYTSLTQFDFSKADIKSESTVYLSALPDYAYKQGVIFTDIKTAIKKHNVLLQKYMFTAIKETEDKFVSLNSAFFNDGVFLYIPKGVVIDDTLRAHFNTTSFNHSVIILEEGARVNYFEEYSSEMGYLNQGNVEIYCGRNSFVEFNYLQNLPKDAFDFSVKRAVLYEDSKIDWMFCSLGAKLGKIKIESLLKGKGAVSEKYGIYCGTENQHHDLFTEAKHMVPNTSANVTIRGILKNHATAISRGLLKIEKEASNTSTYLDDRAIMLGENSLADVIPSLVIDNNNVQAKHAATVGQVDEEQLFYLTSRGLSREDAEMLIVQGFFEPMFNKIKIPEIRNKLQHLVEMKIYGKV